MCMLQWIVALVTRADPRYRNISSKLMKMCLWIIPITSLIVAVVIYPYNMGLEFDISFFYGTIYGMSVSYFRELSAKDATELYNGN